MSFPTTYQNFMSFDDDKTLTITPSNPSDIGDKFISMRVSLTNYSNIAPFDTILRIKIASCAVTSLVYDQVAPQTYNIFDNPLTFRFTDFIQQPDCQFQIEYKVALKLDGDDNYTDFPSFI